MSLPFVELGKHLVAMLFAGGSGLDVETAARVLKVPPSEVEETLAFLREHPPTGLRIERAGGQLELVSDPDSARYVEELLGLNRPVRLSRAALETLAIVAYRQPVTRGDVDGIRGVNSDSAVTTLLNRGLVSEAGRRESPGRPTLYVTTPEFLQHLGIDSLEDLPRIDPMYATGLPRDVSEPSET